MTMVNIKMCNDCTERLREHFKSRSREAGYYWVWNGGTDEEEIWEWSGEQWMVGTVPKSFEVLSGKIER